MGIVANCRAFHGYSWTRGWALRRAHWAFQLVIRDAGCIYLCGCVCVWKFKFVKCSVIAVTATQPPTSLKRHSLSTVRLGRRRHSIRGTHVSPGAPAHGFEWPTPAVPAAARKFSVAQRVCTVENVFLMGQQLPLASAGGAGVMREIVLCCWVGPISPMNEDLLLPTGETFICLDSWKLMRRWDWSNEKVNKDSPCFSMEKHWKGMFWAWVASELGGSGSHLWSAVSPKTQATWASQKEPHCWCCEILEGRVNRGRGWAHWDGKTEGWGRKRLSKLRFHPRRPPWSMVQMIGTTTQPVTWVQWRLHFL